MLWVFLAVLIMAVAVPIWAESRAHPLQNVWIGLKKAAGRLVVFVLLGVTTAYVLLKLFVGAWHMLIGWFLSAWHTLQGWFLLHWQALLRYFHLN